MFPTVIRGLAVERSGKSVVMFGAYHLRNGFAICVLETCQEICIYDTFFFFGS